MNDWEMYFRAKKAVTAAQEEYNEWHALLPKCSPGPEREAARAEMDKCFERVLEAHRVMYIAVAPARPDYR